MICRYSNLFGVRRDGSLGGGLVNAAIRASRTRIPLQIFVNPDNRRDYLYNLDAARQTLEIAADAGSGVTTTIVCSGITRTVSEVMETVGRVTKRRVPVVYGVTPETALQPIALWLRATNPSLPAPTGFPEAIARSAAEYQFGEAGAVSASDRRPR